MRTTQKTRDIAGQFIASINSAVSYPIIGLMEFNLYIPDAPKINVYACPYLGRHNNPPMPINENFLLIITAYDSSFMQGTFGGILTDTSNSALVTIKNGEFNIPYKKM